jgi:hypothetical protein
MHAERHQHHSHHGCHESQGGSSRGPAWLYGYCHDTGKMRMMDYPDYVSNMQTTYSNLYSSAASTAQPYVDMMQGRAPSTGYQRDPGPEHEGHHHHHKDCDCGCGHREHECHDCHCSCCIKCADVVEYARCGEVRQIPVTFDNDTRREREVKLHLGAFVTDSGHEVGWHAALSEGEFKLPPCGEKTVLITVTVDCAKAAATNPAGAEGQRSGSVDSCKVAYATLRAEGCMVRPLIIAVAVLPNDCGAHRAGCQCGCCCC